MSISAVMYIVGVSKLVVWHSSSDVCLFSLYNDASKRQRCYGFSGSAKSKCKVGSESCTGNDSSGDCYISCTPVYNSGVYLIVCRTIHESGQGLQQ
jgi:hypothetical protein